jgi:hypothetical protein
MNINPKLFFHQTHLVLAYKPAPSTCLHANPHLRTWISASDLTALPALFHDEACTCARIRDHAKEERARAESVND